MPILRIDAAAICAAFVAGLIGLATTAFRIDRARTSVANAAWLTQADRVALLNGFGHADPASR